MIQTKKQDKIVTVTFKVVRVVYALEVVVWAGRLSLVPMPNASDASSLFVVWLVALGMLVWNAWRVYGERFTTKEFSQLPYYLAFHGAVLTLLMTL